jgi:hypothetical protein
VDGKLMPEPKILSIVPDPEGHVTINIKAPEGSCSFISNAPLTLSGACKQTESFEKSKCGLKELPSGVTGIFEFRSPSALNSDPSAACVAVLAASPPARYPVLPVLVAFLTLVAAVFSLLDVGSPRNGALVDQTAGQQATLDRIEGRLSAVTKVLFSADAPDKGRARIIPPSPAGVSGFQMEIDRLLSAIDAWCRLAGNRPSEVERSSHGLADLRTRGAQATPAQVANAIQELATSSANAMLKYSDEVLDPGCQNRGLQEILDGVIQAAGLSVILPRQNESINDRLHHVCGSDSAPTPQHRYLISRVVRRGLTNTEGAKVIAKAEVYIFN